MDGEQSADAAVGSGDVGDEGVDVDAGRSGGADGVDPRGIGVVVDLEGGDVAALDDEDDGAGDPLRGQLAEGAEVPGEGK